MKNIDKYYKELMNEDEINLGCYWKRKIAGDGDCLRLSCVECGRRFLQWLKSEYKFEYEEPIKLTKFEYDMLRITKEYHSSLGKLEENLYYIILQDKGYFKNVDLNMTAEEILENCEVIDQCGE